jgi:hypothetical protein
MRKKYGKMTKRVKLLSSQQESNNKLGHTGIVVTHHFEHLPMRHIDMKEIQMVEFEPHKGGIEEAKVEGSGTHD